MFPLYSVYDGWAILLLRLVLGAIFIGHGWPKIKDLRQTGTNFEGMGFKPGIFFGTVAAILEFFGGILFVLGLFVEVVAFFAVIQFLVITIWKIAKNVPFIGEQGWEFDLLILASASVLMMLGAGAWSLAGFLSGGL